ncbi:MAG: alpha/beta hydrolase [Planctomycetaceae bacterium]|nr:alpha/beta hydrolase [Planctomycetaceae bacterium]MCA9074249.1 alpha/beta hydrolase [Planctomycetaceae bacterium]
MSYHIPRGLFVSLLIGLLAVSDSAFAEPPEPILLWPDGAPGAVGEEDADRPSIRIYEADKPNGCAIVICPGGGYGGLAFDHEGHQIAKWCNTIGVTGIVLKYRLGRRYQHPAPLNDVQRAIRYVRVHADELKVAPNRVGVMGFSAGGHLASTVSTHYDMGNRVAEYPINMASCRPDFTILGYPVVSFTEDFTHAGSRRNLLGDDPDPALVESLSNETQVNAQTPPAFLFHTSEDKAVPVANSLAYYAACIKHGVPAELHAYQNGPHGVGLGIADPVLFTWKERLADWLQTNGFLTSAGAERLEVGGSVSLNGEPIRWGTITFVPTIGKQMPIAGGRIGGGKYMIPRSRGVIKGSYSVIIRTLGSVVPEPTIDDVVTLTGQSNREIIIDVLADTVDLNFDIETTSLPDVKLKP